MLCSLSPSTESATAPCSADGRVVEDEVLVGDDALVAVDEERHDVDVGTVVEAVGAPGDVEGPRALAGQVDHLAADERRARRGRGVAAVAADVARERGVEGGRRFALGRRRGQRDAEGVGSGVDREADLADPAESTVRLAAGHEHHVGDAGAEVDGGDATARRDLGPHLGRLLMAAADHQHAVTVQRTTRRRPRPSGGGGRGGPRRGRLRTGPHVLEQPPQRGLVDDRDALGPRPHRLARAVLGVVGDQHAGEAAHRADRRRARPRPAARRSVRAARSPPP